MVLESNDATSKKCEVQPSTSASVSQQTNCGDQTKPTSQDTSKPYVPEVGLYDSKDAPLSDDALYTKARALETTLQGSNFLIFHNGPDFTSVENVFRGMKASEMVRFEKIFDDLDGVDPLRTELKKLNNDAQIATIETMMDKSDGKPNYSGYLSVALETANQDQGNAGMLMRAVFNGMTTKQYADFEKQWESGNFTQYGATISDAITKSNLSESDKALFANFLGKGSETHTTADVVTAATVYVNGLDDFGGDQTAALAGFGDIVNGDAQARAQLKANPDFVAKFNNVFGGTDHFQDYLNEGHVSLISTVDDNKGLMAQIFQGADSDKFVESDLLHASQAERDNYRAGRMLAETGAQVAPGSTEAQQVDYYNRLSDMFMSKGGPAKAAIWADELENGRKTIVSAIAEQTVEGILKPSAVMNSIDSMTQDDWNLLHSANGTPTPEMSLLKAVIAKLSPEAQDQAFARLQTTSEAKSFAAAQTGRSSFTEIMQTNAGDKIDPAAVLNAVQNMTDADRQKYFTDKDFQAQVNATAFPTQRDVLPVIAGNRKAEAQLLMAESLLKQIAVNGKKPQIGAVEAMAQKYINGIVSEDNKTEILQTILKDPAANAELQKRVIQGEVNPDDAYSGTLYDLTAALTNNSGLGGSLDQQLIDGQVGYMSQMYGEAKPLAGFSSLSGATENTYSQNDPMYAVQQNVINQGGQTDLADKAEAYILGQGGDLNGYGHNVDYRYLLSQLDSMTDQQRSDFYAKFQSKYNADFVSSFISHVQQSEHLNDQYSNVFQQAIQQNFDLTLADRVELSVLDGKGGYQAFESELATLNPTQRDQLKSEFAAKGYGDFDSSFLGMIGKKNADLEKYTKLITTAASDPVTDFLNHVVDAKDDLSGADVDGTKGGVLRALASNQEIIAQYNANRAKLPKALLDAIDADYEAAVSNRDTSTDNVKAAVNATIDAIEITAAAATIIGTFGTDSPVAAAFIINASTNIGALSAASRAALDEAVKGQGNLTQQEKNDLILQSTTEAGLFVGPGMAVSILRAAKPGTLKALSMLADAMPKSAPAAETTASALSDAEKAQLALVSEPEFTGTSVDDVFTKPKVAVDGTESAFADTGVMPASSYDQARFAAEFGAYGDAGDSSLDWAEFNKMKQPKPVKLPTETVDATEVVAAPKPSMTRSPQAFDPADVQIDGEAAPDPNPAVQRSPQAFKPEDVQIDTTPIAEGAPAPKPLSAEASTPAPQPAATEVVPPQGDDIPSPAQKFEREAIEDAAAKKADADAKAAADAKAVADAKAAAEAKAAPGTADKAAAINDANILRAVIPPAVITDKAIELGANKQTDFTPPPLLPNSELVKLATVKRGKGPWQSAERILAVDGKKHDIDEVRALTKAIQAVYATDNGNGDMKGLKVKYTFVTQSNFASLLNSVNNDKVKALLMNMATTAAS